MLIGRAVVALIALSLAGLPVADVQAAKPEPDRCTHGGSTKSNCPPKRDGSDPAGCPIVPPLSFMAPGARLYVSLVNDPVDGTAPKPGAGSKNPCGTKRATPPSPADTAPAPPMAAPADPAPGHVS